MKVDIYCDGSSEGNSTGKGGWAFVILVDGVKLHECSGHLPKATNNIAEISAAIEGMAYVASRGDLGGKQSVVIISDSQLVLRYATGEYKCKKQHLVPYYIKLRKLYGELKATTQWVKGHSGNEHNERCDVLAKAAKANAPSS